MSTRCEIRIDGHDPYIYRHSDGYPDGPCGVLATLVPALEWFKHERGYFDPPYLLARLAWKLMNNHPPINMVTGYGIEVGPPHGDIDYSYTVMEDFSVVVKEMPSGKII